MSFSDDILRQCWFLAGPTASGKTAAAVCLAQRINAEIVALDSMTIYRGMDIGTAKPSPLEQHRVRHHLLDIVDPCQEFSLADFLSAAEAVCRDVISRNRIPLFVGGTGLYLRGLLRGVFEGPAADWSIRRRLQTVFRIEGPQGLHDRLRRIDSVTANRLHPNDERRVIRALEVFELTGRPLSELHRHGPKPVQERPPHVYWISPPREWLYRRIDLRVLQMFADGLIDEVRSLLKHPVPLSYTARQALGYKEVIDLFEGILISETGLRPPDADALSEEQCRFAMELIQTRTRQFAKRQHTWFRNLEECKAIEISGTESPDALADVIVQRANQVAADHLNPQTDHN